MAFRIHDGVVVESTDYELTISTPEWWMTPAEDAERAKQAAAGMDDFIQKLTEAIAKHQRGQKDPKSQAGLAAVVPKKILPATMVAEARQEIFEIREEVLRLMDDFRGRQ